MRVNPVLRILGSMLQVIGLAMILPLLWGFYYGEKEIWIFILCIIITFLAGSILKLVFKDEDIRLPEGFGVVTLCWIVIPIFGALPFYLAGYLGFVDAYFETISGFTTTGASVIANVEILPKSILFWRAFTHWLGGIGIIVLALIILPALAVGGRQIFLSEPSGPKLDKLKPQIREVGKVMYGVYLIFTISQIILLVIAGMTLFDASCHGFASLGTGGFSTKNASIGYYNNLYIEAILILFMFLGATSFSLHYLALKGKFSYLKDSEFLLYLGILGIAVSIITLDLRFHLYDSLAHSFRYAIFNAISISSTTGFATTDFNFWPDVSKFVLLLLMLLGGCAGGTAGAIKIIRVLLLLKIGLREINRVIHPNAIFSVKLNGKIVSQEILDSVSGFFVFYMIIFGTCSLIMALLGNDMITSISAVATTMGGVGPGFSLVGPMANYGYLPPIGKLLLCFTMLAGRLEVFGLLVFIAPSFWKE